MAQVLKHGKLYDKVIVCKHCGCEFKPEKDDFHYPKIDMDSLCDSGEFHPEVITEPAILKKLGVKPEEKAYLLNEISTSRRAEVICPECGNVELLDSELVTFGDEDIWIIGNKTINTALKNENTNDDIECEVGYHLQTVGFYSCYRYWGEQYIPCDVPIKRYTQKPGTKAYKEFMKYLKDEMTQSKLKYYAKLNGKHYKDVTEAEKKIYNL